jgi:hypothetical protein
VAYDHPFPRKQLEESLNLNAKYFGLTIPQLILLRADRVIE